MFLFILRVLHGIAKILIMNDQTLGLSPTTYHDPCHTDLCYYLFSLLLMNLFVVLPNRMKSASSAANERRNLAAKNALDGTLYTLRFEVKALM